MRTARRIIQILCLFLFLTLFLMAFYPLHESVPVDLFLRMDLLIALTTSIAGRFSTLNFLPAFVILIITLLMGRFFCGWVCPLGTMLDSADKVCAAQSRNYKNRRLYSYRSMKFVLLVVLLIAALFTMNPVGWLDPISIMTRTTATVFYPIFVYLAGGIIGMLNAFSFAEEFSFHLREILNGFILTAVQPAFAGALFISAMFTLLVGLSQINRRFWCRNMCPLGALLAVTSLIRWYRRFVSSDCIDCGACQRECRMGAIRDDVTETDHAECINCMDCQAVCPVHAVSFGIKRRPIVQPIDFSRRLLLGSAVTGIVTLGLVKTGLIAQSEQQKVVRPPGALDENTFLERCIRCGECIRACSTSGKGLQFTGLESGLEGLGTPKLATPGGYCKYNCNMCGQICPTEAIQPLSLNEKHSAKMGTAHFDKTRCIPWYSGESCTLCEQHCPVPDKAIKLREETVTTIDGQKNRILLPYIVESLCVGCGICAAVCPVHAEKGIFITNDGQQRWTL